MKRALSIFNRDCDAEIIKLDEKDDMNTDYAAYAKGDFYRDGYKGWRKK